MTRRGEEAEHEDERAIHVAAAKFAVLVCVLLTGAMLVWRSDLASVTDLAALRQTVEAAGPWAPLVYIALFALSVVFALPATAITLAGAALFEPVSAYFIILTGALLGAVVSFALGRWLGRDFVARVLGARANSRLGERLNAFDAALERRGFATMTYLRLGHLPYFLPSYLGALTRMSFRDYFWGTLVGSVPNTFVFVFLGDTLRRAWEAGSWHALLTWRAPVAAALVLVSASLPLIIGRAARKKTQRRR